jgi:ABC-type nitrate/sulfonate/bicarbonate transport system permease component
LAAIVGIPLGLVLGAWRVARAMLMPLVRFLMAIPPPALLPIALVLFGTGAVREVGLIAFGCVWPILLNSLAGAGSMEEVTRESSRLLGLRGRRYVMQILLPSAAPQIASGLRIALGFALILMVISEMFVSTQGLGFVLVQGQRTFQIDSMWAVVVLIAIIGIVLNAVLETGLRRSLRWHYGMSEEAV